MLNQSLKCRVTRRSSLNWIYGLCIIYFYSFNYYFLPKKEIKKKKTTSFFIIFKCFVLKRQAWKPKNISTKNKKYVINKIGKKRVKKSIPIRKCKIKEKNKAKSFWWYYTLLFLEFCRQLTSATNQQSNNNIITIAVVVKKCQMVFFWPAMPCREESKRALFSSSS